MKRLVIVLLAMMVVIAPMATTAQAKTVQTVRNHSMMVKVDKQAKDRYATYVYFKGKRVATYRFNRKPNVKFVTTDHLTYNMLAHRKGRTLYIEVLTGTVLDAEGNGKVDTESEFNYINYGRTGYRKGTRVRTYCVYNPFCNAEDDIQYRFDERVR